MITREEITEKLAEIAKQEDMLLANLNKIVGAREVYVSILAIMEEDENQKVQTVEVT